jgi:hypothetical protein
MVSGQDLMILEKITTFLLPEQLMTIIEEVNGQEGICVPLVIISGMQML